MKKLLAISALIGFSSLSMAQGTMELLGYKSNENDAKLWGDITTQLQGKGFNWNTELVEGGVIKSEDVLKERVYKGVPPDAAIIKGQDIARWATLGFLDDISIVAGEQAWDDVLPAELASGLKHNGRYVAAAMHVHRSNWMWVNPTVMTAAELENPPRTWKSFIDSAQKVSSRGYAPLITVSEPWQNTLIFESMLAGMHGPDFYRRVMIDLDRRALRDDRVDEVFAQLAQLRPFLTQKTVSTRQEMVDEFLNNRVAFMFADDWVKGEFNRQEWVAMEDYICAPIPESFTTYLFDVESVGLFGTKQPDGTGARLALAETVMSEAMQADLNISRGSIPARTDISPWGFDRCSVRSMREFRSASKLDKILPSVALGMANTEQVRRRIYESIDLFVNTPSMTPKDGATEFSKAVRYGAYLIR